MIHGDESDKYGEYGGNYVVNCVNASVYVDWLAVHCLIDGVIRTRSRKVFESLDVLLYCTTDVLYLPTHEELHS